MTRRGAAWEGLREVRLSVVQVLADGFGRGVEVAVDAGEGEDGAGSAEGEGGVGVAEMPGEEIDSAGEAGAEVVGGSVEDFAAAGFQVLLKQGVMVAPAVEGAAVEAQGRGDGGVGAAGEDEVDGGELAVGEEDLGALPPNPRSLSNGPTPAEQRRRGRAAQATRPSAVRRAAGLSGRTSALPCLPGGKSSGSSKDAWRPAPDHPWRQAG
jgi:hypothetical protein